MSCLAILHLACNHSTDTGKGHDSDTTVTDLSDSVTDTTEGTVWYQDADGDGYGNNKVTTTSVEHPPGYVSTPGDCNDDNSAIHPAASEYCDDGIDSNCDGHPDASPELVCLPPAEYEITGGGSDDAFGASVVMTDVNKNDIPDMLVGSPNRSNKKGAISIFYDVELQDSGEMSFFDSDAHIVSSGIDKRLGASLQIGNRRHPLTGGFSCYDNREFGADSAGLYVFRDLESLSGEVSASSLHHSAFYSRVPHREACAAPVISQFKDVTDDGTDDMAVGYYLADDTDRHSGIVFLLNDVGRHPGRHVLDEEADTVFTTDPSLGPETYLGRQVVLADLDGDGLSDVVLSAPGNPGRVYIHPGPVTAAEYSTADAGTALQGPLEVDGVAANAMAGYALGTADTNADGRVDLLVGAPWATSYPNGVYVIRGSEDLTNLGPTDMLDASIAELTYELLDEEMGTSVAGVGNIDDDELGTEDVLVGQPAFASSAYLFRSPLSGVVDVDESYASAVIRIDGSKDTFNTGHHVGTPVDHEGHPNTRWLFLASNLSYFDRMGDDHSGRGTVFLMSAEELLSYSY